MSCRPCSPRDSSSPPLAVKKPDYLSKENVFAISSVALLVIGLLITGVGVGLIRYSIAPEVLRTNYSMFFYHVGLQLNFVGAALGVLAIASAIAACVHHHRPLVSQPATA